MRVLIIRAGALGDTLMLMPAISNLRKKAEIVIGGRYPGIDYLKPYVYQCIDIESSGWNRLFIEKTETGRCLLLPKPDYVAAFLTDPEGKVLGNLKDWLPGASINIFPVFPPEEKKIHMALYMAELLESSGLPIDARQSFEDSFKLPLISGLAPPEHRSWIVLHPGSGSKDKNFPPVLWLGLINRLKEGYKEGPKGIVMLLGPAEEGLRPFFRETLKQRNMEMIFCPEKKDLLSLLSMAALYIGHDSGITHLAAMMGVPVIALFRKSSQGQWAPLGPAVEIVKGDEGITARSFWDKILQRLKT